MPFLSESLKKLPQRDNLPIVTLRFHFPGKEKLKTNEHVPCFCKVFINTFHCVGCVMCVQLRIPQEGSCHWSHWKLKEETMGQHLTKAEI